MKLSEWLISQGFDRIETQDKNRPDWKDKDGKIYSAGGAQLLAWERMAPGTMEALKRNSIKAALRRVKR